MTGGRKPERPPAFVASTTNQAQRPQGTPRSASPRRIAPNPGNSADNLGLIVLDQFRTTAIGALGSFRRLERMTASARTLSSPFIRNAPWFIHCLIEPKGCSTVSRREHVHLLPCGLQDRGR